MSNDKPEVDEALLRKTIALDIDYLDLMLQQALDEDSSDTENE